MENHIVSAVLAAGLGTRIKDISEYKPLLKVNGEALISRLVNSFSNNFSEIICFFNEHALEVQSEIKKAISIDEHGNHGNSKVHLFYKNTESSMHTLYEVMKRAKSVSPTATHLFVSMVDTILRPSDFQHFVKHTAKLKSNECSVLITSYIEDEKPLVVNLDFENKLNSYENGARVISFGGQPQNGAFITSGMYCFSMKVFDLLETEILSGSFHMRHFLGKLAKSNDFIVRYNHVDKTLDVDRKEDLSSAEKFLKEEV